MGVIHKLRGDVVSFILAAKKDNPSMGVRQLAVLTSEKFRAQVSKSSVSGLLKRSGMSSSIGRRSGKCVQPDKFFIPKEKKNQISKNMEKAGFTKQENPAESKKEESLKLVEPLKQEESFRMEAVLPAQSQKEQDAPSEKKIPEMRIQEVRPQEKKQGISLSGGSGFIFLKAAEWDICRQTLIAEVFKKYIQTPVSNRFDSVSDMFLFFKFLGIESVEHIEPYRCHGLWAFNYFCGTSAYEEKDRGELQGLFDWTKSMEKTPLMENFSEELQKTKAQAFLEVKGFKLFLEDTSEISMDAAMGSFMSGGKIPLLPRRSFPMQKAMERLSNCLISNVCNAVFQKAPGDTALDRVFYDMVAVFEGIPGKRIIRASVIDEQDEEIAGFSTIPFQKRNFLMGVGPEQKEFQDLTKDQKEISERKLFYQEEPGRTFYYSESETEFLRSFIHERATKASVITLWEEGKSAPFWAILTNNGNKDIEGIIKEYVSHWPYFGETLEEDSPLALGVDGGTNLGGLPDLPGGDNIFSDFVGDLHGYCQKHFFSRSLSKIDLTYLVTNIYSSPGSFLESETSLTVTLDVPERSIDSKDLKYAIQRVNERHILDPLGRRLWLQA